MDIINVLVLRPFLFQKEKKTNFLNGLTIHQVKTQPRSQGLLSNRLGREDPGNEVGWDKENHNHNGRLIGYAVLISIDFDDFTSPFTS